MVRVCVLNGDGAFLCVIALARSAARRRPSPSSLASCSLRQLGPGLVRAASIGFKFPGHTLSSLSLPREAYLLNKYNISLMLITIGAEFRLSSHICLVAHSTPSPSYLPYSGIDYFQIISIFAAIPIQWPPQLTELLLVLSAFNFVRAAQLQSFFSFGRSSHFVGLQQNLDLTAPECAFKVSYTNKWMFIELAPVGACDVFVQHKVQGGSPVDASV